MRRSSRAAGGFTLLEMLAVVFLTSVVMAVAIDFYVDLSRASNRAADYTRDIRRATAILDRVARDFEQAILMRKEPEQDPLTHPWLFLGESRSSALGADHIKFNTRNHTPRGSSAAESDLAVVAYFTQRGADDELKLLRWSSPRLPDSLERDFPIVEDETSLLLAEGLVDFGVRFLDETGNWTDSWDSSTLLDSSELPRAVEIEIALANDQGFFGEEDVASFSRTVLLPVRPYDPAQLVAAAEEAEAEAEGEEPPEESESRTEAPAGMTPDQEKLWRQLQEQTGQ